MVEVSWQSMIPQLSYLSGRVVSEEIDFSNDTMTSLVYLNEFNRVHSERSYFI